MTSPKPHSDQQNKKKLILIILLSATFLAASGRAKTINNGSAPPPQTEKKQGAVITKATASEISNRAQYLYLNGQYLEASLLSSQILKSLSKFPERETVVLIKWLSDLKIDNNPPKEPYIRPTTTKDLPGIVELLEVLYRQGNSKMVNVIAKKLSGSERKYFRAMALYGSNKGAEAIKLLKEIEESSPLYPLAQIFFGQILAISSDLDGAIGILKQTEDLVTAGSEPSGRLHLLLAQLYFDKKEFDLSEKHFMKIRATSPHFKLAISGKIKSKILNNHCKDAIDTIEEVTEKNIFYDSDYISMMINKSHCQLTLGKIDRARDSIVKVIGDIKEIDKELSSLRIASAKSDKVIDVITKKLVRGTSHLDTTKAIQYTANVLEKNKEIQEAVSRYLSLGRMEAAFADLEGDIRKTVASIYSNIDPDLQKAASIKVRLSRIWELQLKLNDKVFDSSEDKPKLKRLDREATERLVGIYSMWERSLMRPLTDGEKRVLHVFALEGPSGLEYLENTLYSDLLYWITLARDRGKNSKSIPEIIIDDLHEIQKGTWIDSSAMFTEIEKKLPSDIETGAKIISDLRKLFRQARLEREKTKTKTDDALERIKQLIRKRLTLASLELKAQTNDAIAMVRDINREIAQGLE